MRIVGQVRAARVNKKAAQKSIYIYNSLQRRTPGDTKARDDFNNTILLGFYKIRLPDGRNR